MPLRHSRWLTIVLVASALLAACAGPSAVQPTGAPTAPTAAPSEAPAATTAPAPPTEAPATSAPATAPATAASTRAPAGDAATATPLAPVAGQNVLPQALYLLVAGQIFRLEPDGVTRTQLTYEVPISPDALAVTDFAVSPLGNALVYTVQGAGGQILVRSGPNGEDPAPLLADSGLSANAPVFTPDGQAVAVRLTAPAEGQGGQSGLYLVPLAGGAPQLLVADGPAGQTDALAYGHEPAAFSPDGSRLLTNRFSLEVDLCDLAVVTLAGAAVVPVEVPQAPDGERQTTCDAAVWAADGAALYYAPVRIGAPAGATGVWRADAATGESFPLTPQPASPPLTLYAFPGLAPEGALLAFAAQADALPPSFADQPVQLAYSMVRLDPASGLPSELRAPVSEAPGQVLWDPAGRGAVALLFPAIGDPGLWWLPADGGAATLLSGATTDLSSFQWAASIRSAGFARASAPIWRHGV